MEKLYFVFDQLPAKDSGGLVATYISLADLLKNDYDIELISVFAYPGKSEGQFPNNKIHVINKKNVDIRFYKCIQYLKKGEIGYFINAICSVLYYFMSIPLNRHRIKKLVNQDKCIVSSPSAAIFMPGKKKFILEVHTGFEYFWGSNAIGRMQSFLMSKPELILFRNKTDAARARNSRYHLNADYMYNYFDDKNIADHTEKENAILFVGRLHEQKNPKRLIRLAKMYKELDSDFKLDIYGEGPEKEEIEKAIKANGLSQNVFLKGYTEDKSIYSKYSLLWLTSEIEGFGLVIIEAKANKVPCITSNWGSAVYEVVQDGVDGFVCDSDEQFVEKTRLLLEDVDLNKKFSKNARDYYLNMFSKEKAYERWMNILKEKE